MTNKLKYVQKHIKVTSSVSTSFTRPEIWIIKTRKSAFGSIYLLHDIKFGNIYLDFVSLPNFLVYKSESFANRFYFRLLWECKGNSTVLNTLVKKFSYLWSYRIRNGGKKKKSIEQKAKIIFWPGYQGNI